MIKMIFALSIPAITILAFAGWVIVMTMAIVGEWRFALAQKIVAKAQKIVAKAQKIVARSLR